MALLLAIFSPDLIYGKQISKQTEKRWEYTVTTIRNCYGSFTPIKFQEADTDLDKLHWRFRSWNVENN